MRKRKEYGIVVESGLLHCPAKTEGLKTSKGSNPFDSAYMGRYPSRQRVLTVNQAA